MDTKNTPSVDALLQKALGSVDAPDIALIRKVKYDLAHKEDIYLNKPRFRRPLRRIAAVIAASFALTTTVFAAGVYTGSFDRLRDIVGLQRADVLQPVEIATIFEYEPDEAGQALQVDGNDGYPAANGAACALTDTENGATYDTAANGANTPNNLAAQGIRAEVVAAGVFDNVVDLYITLQDLVGNRLDDHFQVGHFLAPACDPSISALSLTPEIINRTDCGIVTIRSREIFSRSVAGMRLDYHLRGIFYNIAYSCNTPRFRPLDIDFTEATLQPTVIFAPGHSIAWGGGSRGLEGRAHFDAFGAQLEGDGVPVLQPHLHDIEVYVGGGQTIIISSYGIIDDRLHVQIYRPNPEDMSAHFMLYDYANLGAVTMSFGFTTDAYGNPVFEKADEYGNEVVRYREFIFFYVDLERLADYRMRGAAPGPGADHLPLDWSVSIEVAANDAQLVQTGLNVVYGSATITEIRVTPFLIQMVLDGEAEAGLGAPDIVINTVDGEIVRPAQGMAFTGDHVGNFFFDMGESPLNLNDIASIEVGVEVVSFS